VSFLRRPRTLASLAILAGLLALCAYMTTLSTPRTTATSTPLPRRTRAPSTPQPTSTPRATPTPRPTPEGLPLQASLGDTWIRPADGMVMVFVPGGRFDMGSDKTQPDAEDDEIPRHSVALSSFWLDQTEVTNAQFARCVAAEACTPPYPPVLAIHEGYYEGPEYASYPAINVDWQHGQNYCNWAGGQLPTEAQWEYAARGPNGRLYPWGDRPPDETLLNYAEIVNNTTPVGSYTDGASWVGAFDMAGNVWEWTADWYRFYPSTPQINPTGPDRGPGHVLRGGSWYDGASFVRSANRYVVREAYAEYGRPRSYGFGVGFRCVVQTGELPPYPEAR